MHGGATQIEGVELEDRESQSQTLVPILVPLN